MTCSGFSRSAGTRGSFRVPSSPHLFIYLYINNREIAFHPPVTWTRFAICTCLASGLKRCQLGSLVFIISFRHKYVIYHRTYLLSCLVYIRLSSEIDIQDYLNTHNITNDKYTISFFSRWLLFLKTNYVRVVYTSKHTHDFAHIRK